MKSRLEEISAVEDTIGILNSDEAFANFDKTTRGFVEDQKFVEQSSALVQTSSRRAREATSAMLRARAVDVLRKAAGQTGLPELALIAASAEIDEFTKVKGLIDKLVAELKAQQLDEVKMRDWCIDEFATNKEETQAGDHKMSNLQQKKKDLEARIEELSEKIQQIIEKMAESQKQMGLASDNRESEAADLATTIQDQRLTQLILDRALKRMKEVYAFMQQQPGAAHIATSGTHTDAGNGPARFTKYGQNAGGARVVSLLQIVIADSQKLEDEALTQDLDSQTEYEDFMKASNAELAHDLSTKASMEEALAKAKKDLVATKEDIMDTLKVLEGLSAYKGDLHKSCDFIAKNFEARQAARQAEMEALAEAKAILSGMGRHTLESEPRWGEAPSVAACAPRARVLLGARFWGRACLGAPAEAETLLGALLLLVTLPCSVVAKASRLRSDAADQLGGRPVAKIVRMLQDVQAELTKEMEDDKAVFASLGCWCKTNEEEKTKAIEVGQATIASLEASIGADLAKIKELETKRKATMDELYADQKALDQATELRMQENKAFHQTETEFLEAIGACKGAIQVLGVHQADLAQVQAIAKSLRRARVQDLALTAFAAGHAASAHTRAKVLAEFLDTAEKGNRQETTTMAFLSIPGYSSYKPQSSQIYGILEQMLVDFKSNLANEQASEKKSVENFEALKAAKLDEIAAGNKLVSDIDATVAGLKEKNAQELKELADTEEQLSMDQAFLADLQQKCAASDAEFESRTKSRLDEIAAVEDTIKILNSDESFANFEKTTKGFVEGQKFVEATSFLQESSSQEAAQRMRVAALLRKAAGGSSSAQLALLAASAEIDAFTKVKEEIDKLIAELKAQQSDEVKMRDWCIDEFATNKDETQTGDHKMSNLQQKEKDLEARIEELTSKIQVITEEMAESQKQMGRASDNRETEAAELAETIQ
ncbi:unnamed protein product, partial [Prorocentrum cordatum]